MAAAKVGGMSLGWWDGLKGCVMAFNVSGEPVPQIRRSVPVGISLRRFPTRPRVGETYSPR